MKAEANPGSDVWMRQSMLVATLAAFACAGCHRETSDSHQPPTPTVTFKPQEMADALHAVIAADREVYALQVLKLLRGEKTSSPQSQKEPTNLPLPAHLLRMGSEVVQKNGAEFHYVLRSLSPINPRNAPETEIEKAGLQFVTQHPNSNFYSEESLGGRRYLTAVYPDLAISPACADCHNDKGQDRQHAYQIGDVLGGIIVRVPLEF
jgi:uncharacterized protein DUF3365